MPSHSLFLRRVIVTVCLSLVATLLLCGTALAGEVTYGDNERRDLDDHNTTYVIRGDGTTHKSGNYFYVPGNKSSEENPLVIILDNVNRTQEGCSPTNSFITIAANNYVIVKLRGTINATGGGNEATRHVRGRLRPVPRIRSHGTERYHLALARG